MIDIYDIINTINNFITKGTLVLHRSMQVHPKFRIYKNFYYKLYHVEEDSKKSILEYKETRNIPVDNLTETWKECDKNYLNKLFEWLLSEDFKILKNGI